MRKIFFVFLVVAGLACLWLAIRKPRMLRQNLVSYFQNAPGLESGAALCVDGVRLGTVTGVRVRPELGERPVEVSMQVSSPYELRIPNDSTVSLSTEGVLGPTFVDINTRYAHGPAAENHGTLKSLETADSKAAERVAEVLKDAFNHASRNDRVPEDPSDKSAKPVADHK